jgi:hypothetical protein
LTYSNILVGLNRSEFYDDYESPLDMAIAQSISTPKTKVNPPLVDIIEVEDVDASALRYSKGVVLLSDVPAAVFVVYQIAVIVETQGYINVKDATEKVGNSLQTSMTSKALLNRVNAILLENAALGGPTVRPLIDAVEFLTYPEKTIIQLTRTAEPSPAPTVSPTERPDAVFALVTSTLMSTVGAFVVCCMFGAGVVWYGYAPRTKQGDVSKVKPLVNPSRFEEADNEPAALLLPMLQLMFPFLSVRPSPGSGEGAGGRPVSRRGDVFVSGRPLSACLPSEHRWLWCLPWCMGGEPSAVVMALRAAALLAMLLWALFAITLFTSLWVSGAGDSARAVLFGVFRWDMLGCWAAVAGSSAVVYNGAVSALYFAFGRAALLRPCGMRTLPSTAHGEDSMSSPSASGRHSVKIGIDDRQYYASGSFTHSGSIGRTTSSALVPIPPSPSAAWVSSMSPAVYADELALQDRLRGFMALGNWGTHVAAAAGGGGGAKAVASVKPHESARLKALFCAVWGVDDRGLLCKKSVLGLKASFRIAHDVMSRRQHAAGRDLDLLARRSEDLCRALRLEQNAEYRRGLLRGQPLLSLSASLSLSLYRGAAEAEAEGGQADAADVFDFLCELRALTLFLRDLLPPAARAVLNNRLLRAASRNDDCVSLGGGGGGGGRGIWRGRPLLRLLARGAAGLCVAAVGVGSYMGTRLLCARETDLTHATPTDMLYGSIYLQRCIVFSFLLFAAMDLCVVCPLAVLLREREFAWQTDLLALLNSGVQWLAAEMAANAPSPAPQSAAVTDSPPGRRGRNKKTKQKKLISPPLILGLAPAPPPPRGGAQPSGKLTLNAAEYFFYSFVLMKRLTPAMGGSTTGLLEALRRFQTIWPSESLRTSRRGVLSSLSTGCSGAAPEAAPPAQWMPRGSAAESAALAFFRLPLGLQDALADLLAWAALLAACLLHVGAYLIHPYVLAVPGGLLLLWWLRAHGVSAARSGWGGLLEQAAAARVRVTPSPDHLLPVTIEEHSKRAVSPPRELDTGGDDALSELSSDMSISVEEDRGGGGGGGEDVGVGEVEVEVEADDAADDEDEEEDAEPHEEDSVAAELEQVVSHIFGGGVQSYISRLDSGPVSSEEADVALEAVRRKYNSGSGAAVEAQSGGGDRDRDVGDNVPYFGAGKNSPEGRFPERKSPGEKSSRQATPRDDAADWEMPQFSMTDYLYSQKDKSKDDDDF